MVPGNLEVVIKYIYPVKRFKDYTILQATRRRNKTENLFSLKTSIYMINNLLKNC